MSATPDPSHVLSGDVQAMAHELQEALEGGDFNPFALLSGQRRFHGLFLAPLSPGLAAAILEFLEKGTGPLAEVAQQMQTANVSAAEAMARARAMFAATRGMLVLVVVDELGPSAVSTPFYGQWDPEYSRSICSMFEKSAGNRDALQAAVLALGNLLESHTGWPHLFAAVEGTDSAWDFWDELGGALMVGQASGMTGHQRSQRAQLAHWVARALNDLGRLQPEARQGEHLMLQARLHVLAGEVAAGASVLDQLLGHYEVDPETLVLLLPELVEAGVVHRAPQAVADCLEHHRSTLDQQLGRCWELSLARFRILAAIAAGPEILVAAANELQRADRKSFRQALHREPVWQVAIADPGELLDTVAAAGLIDRSPTFIAKRLEQGTLPWFREGDTVRIPKTALLAWKAVMDAFRLLD